MKQKKLSMGKLTVRVLIPVMILFIGIFYVMFQSMLEARSLVYRYIEDTARLYIDQINTEIVKINYDVISVLNKNEKDFIEVGGLKPDEGTYYPKMLEVSNQLLNLKVRYEEVSSFYLYIEEKDMIITNNGVVFSFSMPDSRNEALRESLRQNQGIITSYSVWNFINDGEQDYVYSRYSKNGVSMGCLIGLEDLLSKMRVNSLGYEGIPLIVDSDGGILLSESDRNKVITDEDGKMEWPATGIFSEKKLLSFPISSILGDTHSFYILVNSTEGILERIMSLQIVLVILSLGIVLGSILVFKSYQNRILRPMKQFVNSLKNTEEEQWINENGSNNILELELASAEFKGLLRKIKALKIDIYEKELARQKTELEAMQMQIKPHFYLNCLSLIHGMADLAKQEKILTITENLSNYMRYVMRDSFEKELLGKEVEMVRNYASIQQIQYGRGAFSFEVIMEESEEECLVPALLIHNFVENAITHAVSLDSQVDITLYVVRENYEDEEYLYLCISDTGKGFSEDILTAIREGKSIYYNGREHIGISNSMKRLKLIYGEKANISFSNMDEGYGAVVEIRIPAEQR